MIITSLCKKDDGYELSLNPSIIMFKAALEAVLSAFYKGWFLRKRGKKVLKLVSKKGTICRIFPCFPASYLPRTCLVPASYPSLNDIVGGMNTLGVEKIGGAAAC